MASIKVNYSENLPGPSFKTRRFDVELCQDIRGDITEEKMDAAVAKLFETAKRNVAYQIQLAKNTMSFPG
jgi:hypothetical protein